MSQFNRLEQNEIKKIAESVATGGGVSGIDDLTDVLITSASAYDAIMYDAVDNRWENTKIDISYLNTINHTRLVGRRATVSGAPEEITIGNGLKLSNSGELSTNIIATDIQSGVINSARLGSGTANTTTYLRGDNTWSTIPTLFACPQNPTVAPLSGWYFAPCFVASSHSTQLVGATTAYLCPYVAPFDISFNQIAAQVTTLQAGSTFDTAIYASGSNGWPTGAPIIQSGSMSGAALGTVTVAVSGTLVKGNQYWFALQGRNGTPTVRAIAQAQHTSLRVDPTSTAAYNLIRYTSSPGVWRNFTTTPVVTADVALGNTAICYLRAV